MWNKKNRPKLSPEQKRQLEEGAAREKRLRESLDGKIYPIFKEESKSIGDALIFADALGMAIDQKFSSLRGKMKLSELNLKDDIRNNPEARRYARILEALEGETIGEAIVLLKSVKAKIEQRVQEELQSAKVEKSSIILPK